MRIPAILLLGVSCTFGGLFDYLPAAGGGQVVRHFAYSLEFSVAHRDARWVAYLVSRDRVETLSAERGNNFRTDPLVRRSAVPGDYTHSGYDRGHLCPAGDMRWDAAAMSESFYMSNMTPQAPSFNRGCWKNLEELVRNWAVLFDTLYVVTGPMLRDGLPVTGDSVAVPVYFYKVVLKYDPPLVEAVGFIMKNEGSRLPLENFAVAVDVVEQATGIDFFPALPDSTEKKTESSVDRAFWRLTPNPGPSPIDGGREGF
ncbi:MAG: DNA/RNA non-specific endonuclease [Chitinispirillaceae bacterium]|jgi:endonuclease G|nr:DNA/RNA non-specific endonuclease [Chitinispirillaceae bacterium]